MKIEFKGDHWDETRRHLAIIQDEIARIQAELEALVDQYNRMEKVGTRRRDRPVRQTNSNAEGPVERRG